MPGTSTSFACIQHRFINSSCLKDILDGISLHDLDIVGSFLVAQRPQNRE